MKVIFHKGIKISGINDEELAAKKIVIDAIKKDEKRPSFFTLNKGGK